MLFEKVIASYFCNRGAFIWYNLQRWECSCVGFQLPSIEKHSNEKHYNSWCVNDSLTVHKRIFEKKECTQFSINMSNITPKQWTYNHPGLRLGNLTIHDIFTFIRI